MNKRKSKKSNLLAILTLPWVRDLNSTLVPLETVVLGFPWESYSICLPSMRRWRRGRRCLWTRMLKTNRKPRGLRSSIHSEYVVACQFLPGEWRKNVGLLTFADIGISIANCSSVYLRPARKGDLPDHDFCGEFSADV